MVTRDEEWRQGDWEFHEGGKKIQTSRYEINKYYRDNVQHDD